MYTMIKTVELSFGTRFEFRLCLGNVLFEKASFSYAPKVQMSFCARDFLKH